MRIATLAAAAALIAASPPSGADQVRANIQQIADAGLRQDLEATMAVFHKDVVLTYPAAPDVAYDAIRKSFGDGLAKGPVKVTAEVLEVEASGDLAFARILWTAKPVSAPAEAEAEPSHEVDLEIWKRTRAGWRLYRGLVVPLRKAQPRS